MYMPADIHICRLQHNSIERGCRGLRHTRAHTAKPPSMLPVPAVISLTPTVINLLADPLSHNLFSVLITGQILAGPLSLD